MKKISLIAVLVIAMLFSLTGCGKTDFDLYSDACKNSQEMKGIDIEGSATVALRSKDGTVNFNVPISFAAKMVDVNDENSPISLSYTVTAMGSEETISIYSADGYQYSYSASKYEGEILYENKIKQKLDEADSDIPSFKEDAKVDVDLFDEEDFKDIAKEEVEGGYKYTITKTSEEIKAFAEKLANSFVDALDVDDDEKEDTRKDVLDTLKSVVFGDLTVTFVIKDGYFTDITLEMKGLSVDVDDSDNIEDEDISIITGAIGMFTVDFNMNFKCNSRGKEVTITPPSDLDEYEEYSFDIDDIFPPVDF